MLEKLSSSSFFEIRKHGGLREHVIVLQEVIFGFDNSCCCSCTLRKTWREILLRIASTCTWNMSSVFCICSESGRWFGSLG